MDSLSDDDIELLKQTPEEDSQENTASGSSQLDSNFNTQELIKRAKYSNDSLDLAPALALQTAFSSLQKKHNDQLKKNKELVQVNKSFKKALMDATQGNQGQFQNMDGYMQDAQVVHAAGGTSEDDSIAENRAKQGYVQHLQREVLISANAIQLGNEEIARLKHSNEEYEREAVKHLRKIEELHSNCEAMTEDIKVMRNEIDRKNLEVAQMKNALQSEQELNHNLKLSNESLQEQLETNKRTGFSGQSEIQTLRSSLAAAENELRKSVSQYRELDRKFVESEKSRGILEAKCKQYEIEVNIRSQQRQVDDTDDVDGDVEALKKALDILRTQQDEVKDLKKKISDQQRIISQIQSTGKKLPGRSLDTSSFRPEAQGSSFNPYQELPVYENYSGLHQNAQIGHSPISRRSSDRGDYRSRERPGQKTSPRVDDTIRPTGNVTPMLAMETNQQPKRMELAGNFDSANVVNHNRSPAENLIDPKHSNIIKSNTQENTFPRTSVSANQPAYAQQSPRNAASPRAENIHDPYGSAFVESPRAKETFNNPNVSNNPALFQSSSQETAFIQAGARPRVPTSSANINYLNQFDSQEISSPRQKQQQRIPDRMTQSEIIVRGRPSDNNAMTRSVLDPLQPLEIPQSANGKQSEFVHAETSGVGQNIVIQQQNASDHTYQNQYREQYNEPDYENIYNANAQTETKRPIEEHEDTVFVTANPRELRNIVRPVQEETTEGNVAAVKICPVCNEEFSRLTQDQFQMHVFECFDTYDESPATLQPAAGGTTNDDDRTCPMCGDVFPVTIPQETYEQHVLAHFGEDPMVERFELLQP
ncbi:uncharacterized protein LOC123561513 [Mercenaria mercenaria]|uniref:uncharacterized protein LOC123561513 n=1 Tax=Mercenaria mercenaria TaxID=6596 RepID=UPI00234EA050|nr:uncharacterized protein LOC123561513 [Mercenaria mercenaria]XP_045209883.2 uncharacterized protein LOC123561513 [Mercenaria mercenaria]XP_045209884.2 uncharacterized protein LOC123561513 [Mercenaria mercenaria]XP_045209885.2 uncharacterized protein LOC123561513 [Mercenaria mercenaria]XP_045209886.2 uncharacterized protein LOC123561513 [Mercenaria mercenaria]XP_045209887.2 uncharacterized protein LOC123561513 [Mercenaria mercenaria]